MRRQPANSNSSAGSQQQQQHHHQQQQQQSTKSPTIRILVLGERNVGKSALVVRFLTKRFIGEYVSGIEIAYQHEVNLAGTWVTTEICDAFISKEQQECELRKAVARSDACLVVYSICDRRSYVSACATARRIRDIRQSTTTTTATTEDGGGELPLLLVGNKADLEHFREVKTSEGKEAADSIDLCHFAETSAAESFAQVEDVFRRLFRLVRACFHIAAASSSSSSSSHHHKNGTRRKSLSQVAHMIMDHYRRQHQHGASNHLGSRSMSLDRVAADAGAVVAHHPRDGDKSTTSTDERQRKSATHASSCGADVKHRRLSSMSKCLSLSTLSEHPSEDVVDAGAGASRTLPPSARRRADTHTCSEQRASLDDPASLWRRKVSASHSPPDSVASRVPSETSTDGAISLSDLSTADDDCFVDEDRAHHHHHHLHLARQRCISGGRESPVQHRASRNKKNLQITVTVRRSDADLASSDGAGDDEICVPSSAPAIASNNNRFRFFPHQGFADQAETLLQRRSNGVVKPPSPLLHDDTAAESRRPAPAASDATSKRTQGLLRMFFKGSAAARSHSASNLITKSDFRHHRDSHFRPAPTTTRDADDDDDDGPIFFRTSPSSLVGAGDLATTTSFFKGKGGRRRMTFRETVGEIMRRSKRPTALVRS